MAGGKETPRQKMIGMMYLVLLAMLAMNVSKQIINAFVTLNDKLAVSENALVAKTEGTYQMFDAKMVLPENKKIVKPWLDRAHQIKKLANGLNNFLVTECSAMLEVVEQKPWHEFDEVTGVAHLKPLMDVEQKDNYDVPTSFFAAEGPGTKRGQELRNRIHNYRDSVCTVMANYKEGKKTWSFTPAFDGSSMVEFDLQAQLTNRSDLDEALKGCNPKDTAKIANIYMALSQPAKYSNHGEEYSWEMTMFDHAPVVAAGAMFTAFIVDLRNAESAAVEFLYGKVEVPTFNFNKIEPLAFAPTGYINQGDSIPLSVMIAAYDSTEVPVIKYGIDADTLPENWKTINGKIGIRGDKPGAHRAKGVIMVKQKGELVPKPWRFDYTVGAPMGVIAQPDMRILYWGYDNVLEGTASGFPADKVKVSGPGISGKGGGKYVVRVSRGTKSAKYSVVGTKDDGGSVNLGSFEFECRPMPNPTVYFGKTQMGGTSPYAAARAQTGIRVAYDPSVPLKGVKFPIKGGVVKVEGVAGTGKITAGGKFDSKAKGLLKQSKGKMVTIIVNYKMPTGVGKKGGVSFTVK
jgi:hypothetical protein